MKIKELLQKIKLKLKHIFSNYSLYSKTAVTITQALKTMVESKIIEDITKSTTFVWDDIALVALKIHVPKIAYKIAIVHEIVELGQEEKALENILVYLQTLNKDARVDFWIRFSAELTKALSDDVITLNEAIILSQMAFKELYEDKK